MGKYWVIANKLDGWWRRAYVFVKLGALLDWVTVGCVSASAIVV